MKIIIGLLFCCFMSSAFAEKYFVVNYTVQAKDTYASILKKFVKLDSIINKHTPMIKKTEAENPHVKDWAKLAEGVKIKLFISEEFLDKSKLDKYNKLLAERKKKLEQELLKKRKPFRLSFFYMASTGTFNQSNEKYMRIEFVQYSYFTLGTSFLYFPKNKNYHWASSIYLSKLGTSTNNLNDDSISIRPELGVNGYFSYKPIKKSYSIYGGFDYETFSTFNLESIQIAHDFLMNETQMFYLTLGFSKNFYFYKKPIFIKASISKQVATSYTSGSSLYDPGVPYSGFKMMFYLNKKFNKKWFLHILYKMHFMSGPDDLTVHRLGVGFGYILF